MKKSTFKKHLEQNLQDNIHARIFFIQARNSNRAIVFRRGPTDWIQMNIWNLDTDTLENGQWINKKVPMRNCDLSPSGKYLIYYVDNLDSENCRTVISKPPFWTALTAWEHSVALFDKGGGLLIDEKTILLNLQSSQPLERYPAPMDLNIQLFETQKQYSLPKGHVNLLHEHRLEMNGWKEQNEEEFIQKETKELITDGNEDFWTDSESKNSKSITPKLWKKRITNSTALYLITYYQYQNRKNVDLFYFGRKEERIILTDFIWADVDHRNRIIATKEGKLYASEIAIDNSVDYLNFKLLHDLNSQKPKQVFTPLNKKSWEESK